MRGGRCQLEDLILEILTVAMDQRVDKRLQKQKKKRIKKRNEKKKKEKMEKLTGYLRRKKNGKD